MSTCIITNCRRRAPSDNALCGHHRDKITPADRAAAIEGVRQRGGKELLDIVLIADGARDNDPRVQHAARARLEQSSDVTQPWCSTCGTAVSEIQCPTCAKWWADNPPPGGEVHPIGAPVKKATGFAYRGFIVAAFRNRAGALRYVVEHATETGMLHIYSPAQLELREDA